MSGAPRLPSAYRLVALDRVDSTNEEAKRLAEQGAAEGTLVWAREQTAGRGRRGRRWDSLPGNLYLSFVLRPDRPALQTAQLGMVAAVVAREALTPFVAPLVDVRLKWPNDILLNGRKAGGILLESAAQGPERLAWLVLGIGVNVASHPEGTEFPATCLEAEARKPVSVVALLESFGELFLRWYGTWKSEGFSPVRQAWREGAWRRGETIEVRLEERKSRGVFADLDEQGALLLDLPDGTRRRITAADVFALPPTR